jgi:hypothetical protein
MISIPDLRNLLEEHGELEGQSASDWRGDFPLPAPLEAFYREVGPKGRFINERVGYSGITIPSLGDPFWIPPLERVWAMQAGYRWHGITGARLEDWDDAWLVVADQGGDPFILHRDTGQILHAEHGAGVWEPDMMFADVWAMAACLATIGSVVEHAGDDLWIGDFERINPDARAELETRLRAIVGDKLEARSLADFFGF